MKREPGRVLFAYSREFGEFVYEPGYRFRYAFLEHKLNESGGESQTPRQFCNLVLHQILSSAEGFVYRGGYKVLEHLYIVVLDDFGLDFDENELSFRIRDDGHHPAARRGFDGLFARLRLELLHLFFHFVCLFEKVLDVSAPEFHLVTPFVWVLRSRLFPRKFLSLP